VGTGPLIKIGTTNTAEVLKYIFDEWSNLTADASNFSDLATDIDKYENHFTLRERRDVIELAEDISFQARVGLNYDGANVRGIYLSKETAGELDIDEKEINNKSMKLESVPIEQIITVYQGTWRDKESNSIEGLANESGTSAATPLTIGEVQFQETHVENIVTFGEISERRFLYIYGFGRSDWGKLTDFYLVGNTNVKKTADFWGHRFANPWRIVNIVNFQNTMKLEIFDIVKFISTYNAINISGVPGGGQSDIAKLLNTAPEGIKGVVIGMKQNRSTDTVDLVVVLESVQGLLNGEGEGIIDDDFWLDDTNDPLTQGPPLANISFKDLDEVFPTREQVILGNLAEAAEAIGPGSSDMVERVSKDGDNTVDRDWETLHPNL
jgi:hypothetical protein